jgi:hypothetical protein
MILTGMVAGREGRGRERQRARAAKTRIRDGFMAFIFFYNIA